MANMQKSEGVSSLLQICIRAVARNLLSRYEPDCKAQSLCQRRTHEYCCLSAVYVYSVQDMRARGCTPDMERVFAVKR